MRIVELIPSLEVGGAERVAALLARELSALGHEVDVVSLFDPVGSWVEEDLRRAGVPIHFLGKRPGFDARMVPRLAGLLTTRRPDVLHTHLHTLKYALPARVAWRGRMVHTVHNLAEHEVEAESRIVHRIAFRTGVAPVAIGAAVTLSLRREYGIRPRSVIPNGIPLAACRVPEGTREVVRAELGIPGDAPVFVTVGRLDAQKDHAGLLAAFATSRVAARGGRLLIAGDGGLRPVLEERARAHGLADKVRFLGVRRDVPRLLAAADAFVLASRWEGNPLVILEAMAAGLPVVATAVGCVPELVSARTGWLVPAGDVTALAQTLAQVARGLPEARARGRSGAEVANARFDSTVMARAYATLFAEVAC